MTKADDASGSWIIRVDLIGLGWCRSRHQILPEPIQLGQKYVQQKRDNASSSWGHWIASPRGMDWAVDSVRVEHREGRASGA